MRSPGFRPASVERRSAFEAPTLYAQTLHALRVLAGHNVRIAPKVWKLFLHELLDLLELAEHVIPGAGHIIQREVFDD